MQTVSELWSTLRATPRTEVEYQFDIAGSIYGHDAEVSHEVNRALYTEYGFGNASCASLTLQLYADDIPKSAKIQRFCRLVNGDQATEWLPAGVFYTSHRSKEDGLWDIEAFDDMRKAEKVWEPDQSLEFPMPMDEAVAEICRVLGYTLDSRTEISHTYTLDYPQSEQTFRQTLKWIAAAHGGNFIFTPAGELRLVPLLSASADTHSIGLDLYSLKNNGLRKPVSRITLLSDDENAYTAGDDTGLELVADCPYATQAMVDALLAALAGYEYQAFSAEGANIDPAAELGDGVTADGVSFVLASISEDGGGYPDISAPGDVEQEEEYPEGNYSDQAFNRKLAQTRSLISKTSEEIRLSVNGLDERVSKIELNKQGITLSVSNGEESSVIKLMAGETELSSQTIKMTGLVTIAGLSGGTTTIDGACVKTGKISADRIDVGDLKFQTLWGSISKKAIVSAENAIYIGGDESIMSFSDVYIRGTNITFNAWSAQSKGLLMSPVSSTLEPVTAKEGKIGSSSKPFGEVHCGKLYLNGSELDPDRSKLYYSSTVYATLNSDKELVGSSQYYSLGNKNTPWANGYFTKLYLGGDELRKDRVSQSTSVYAELNASKQFVPALSAGYSMGSSGTPWATGYFTKLYLNGTELTTSASVSKLVNGSNSVELNASKQLVPYTATGYSLGSSSYPFESCYLGKGTIQIGANSLSTGTKIGFYGATPIVRQTLSTSSQNMGYTSATSSNYLTILNNVVGILKKIGLIG